MFVKCDLSDYGNVHIRYGIKRTWCWGHIWT